MSQRLNDLGERQFFKTLASSPASYAVFLDYLRDTLDAERKALESVAVAALVDESKRPFGQVQLGKVEMLRELLTYAERFARKEQ